MAVRAEQTPAEQQLATPVPSIEELKRQLEAKREAKRQLEAQRQLEAKQQVEAKQEKEAKSEPEPNPPAALHQPAGSPTPAIPKFILPVKLAPNSVAPSESCPYPAAARARGDTGTVILLIYVTPDGRATEFRIETSSGSDSLDEAAGGCAMEYGRYLPKRGAARGQGAWFRMKFIWSFGE